MDRIIGTYKGQKSDNLIICEQYGVAYQRNMAKKIKYQKKYFDSYVEYRGTEVSKKLNGFRVTKVISHLPPNATVLDVGIGAGEFVDICPLETAGFDINPFGIKWLEDKKKFYDVNKKKNFDDIKAFCFWDVLEHIEKPDVLFSKMAKDSMVFVSIPIVNNFDNIENWKHYKPGEHLYYFTLKGFITWMDDWGFSMIDSSSGEMTAGREDIYTFVFKKDGPDYRDLIGMYAQEHTSSFYGSSSDVFLNDIYGIIRKRDVKSIVDFGCGRSDLLGHFWNDGARKLTRYDPAIPKYKRMPDERHDLVICSDVMEHILKRDVERIFYEIKKISNDVIFSIAQKLARKKLANGMNAHVCIESEAWWANLIRRHFGHYKKIRNYEIGFLCKTFE